MKAPAAREHHARRDEHDRRRVSDGAPDQRHRQQRLHFHAAHAPRDIRLQQRAKLLRVKDRAGRAAEFHRREQILAQPRLRVLDQPRNLTFVGRVQEFTEALPPQDDQHCRVRSTAQRPPHPFGQHPFQIHGSHREQQQHQRGEPREHALDDDEPPAPPGECVQFS